MNELVCFFEGIRDAASIDESHQITSWSEQSGGVIPFRSGCLKRVALSAVGRVSNVCFCDAELCFHLMLQHPEAILGPFVSGTQKVTNESNTDCAKYKDSLREMSWLHPLNQSARLKNISIQEEEVSLHI